VRNSHPKLTLQDNLINENAKHSPIIVHLCSPQIRIHVPFAAKEGTGRSIHGNDCAISPKLRDASLESLKVVINIEGGGTDDLGISDLSCFEGCSEVD
jgi:hypothetical protein